VEEKDTVVVRGKVDAHNGDGSQLGGQWGARNEEDGVSIEHGGGMAAQRPDKRNMLQSGNMERVLASWPCHRGAAGFDTSEVLQAAVESQMASEALVARTVIEGLVNGTFTTSAAAITVAQFLQLSYGPTASGVRLDLPVKMPDDGRLELLRILEIVLCAGAAALVRAKIEGYAAAVGELTNGDVVEAEARLEGARQLRQTAELAKRAATGRVVSAVILIQAAARARPARRIRAYARLAEVAALASRRREAAVRLQTVARGVAAMSRAAGLRSWASRVVGLKQLLGAVRLRGGGVQSESGGAGVASPLRKGRSVGVEGSQVPDSPQSVMEAIWEAGSGVEVGAESVVAGGVQESGLHEAGDARPRRRRARCRPCRSERLAMQKEREEGWEEDSDYKWWDDEDGLFGPVRAEERDAFAWEDAKRVNAELAGLGYLHEERAMHMHDDVWRMRRRLGLLGYGVGVHKADSPGEADRRQARLTRENSHELSCGCGYGYVCITHAARGAARQSKPQAEPGPMFREFAREAGIGPTGGAKAAASGTRQLNSPPATEARGDQSVQLMSVLVPAALSGDREFVVLVPGGRQLLVRAPEGAEPGSQLTIAVSSQDVPKLAVPQEPTEAAVDTAASAAVSTDAEAQAFVTKLLALHDLALARGVGLTGASGAPAGGGRK
jgi:hypothetical protein